MPHGVLLAANLLFYMFPSLWEGLRILGNSPMYNSYGGGFTSPENFGTGKMCTKFYQVSWC